MMPLVFLRLKAPLSISVCTLFLLVELGIDALRSVLIFAATLFFVVYLKTVVPLSNFTDPNDGERCINDKEWLIWFVDV